MVIIVVIIVAIMCVIEMGFEGIRREKIKTEKKEKENGRWNMMRKRKTNALPIIQPINPVEKILEAGLLARAQALRREKREGMRKGEIVKNIGRESKYKREERKGLAEPFCQGGGPGDLFGWCWLHPCSCFGKKGEK